MTSIEQRLMRLKLEIPDTNPPQGDYVGYVRSGSLVFVSGQGPRLKGQLMFKGIIGEDLTIEQGQQAARLCALNILGQLRHACGGDLERIAQMVRIAGLVRSAADFEGQTQIINAASALICDVLGEAGRHARIASGTHALPSGMAVEIEAIAEIR